MAFVKHDPRAGTFARTPHPARLCGLKLCGSARTTSHFKPHPSSRCVSCYTLAGSSLTRRSAETQSGKTLLNYHSLPSFRKSLVSCDLWLEEPGTQISFTAHTHDLRPYNMGVPQDPTQAAFRKGFSCILDSMDAAFLN